MRAAHVVLLIAASGLAGCDRLTGADQKKILDAEAVGYACRVSLKTPEDCMKENESQSPTSILTGWKSANKDIDAQLIDPAMGKGAKTAEVSAEAEGNATGKPDEKVAGKTDEKAVAKSDEKKPVESAKEQPKSDKPAAKPDTAAHKAPAH